jgi:cellulose synthase/poly-beta-1,6-N-acetylglucosamine synthase-like glycosyltransferase
MSRGESLAFALEPGMLPDIGSMWATFLFAGTGGLFLIWAVCTLWHVRWVKRLPTAGPPGRDRIHCSVVIAARDEEARIEQAIRNVLAQGGVELELIAVDDRSRDRTGEIVQRMAQRDGRVRVIRVETLPEGWLGKCHACHLGAAVATGDWILFTDADCWLRPDVIARALAQAKSEQADHITLVSGLARGNRWLKAAHLLFLISLSNWFSGVNRDRPRSYMGIGAFNLVRADAYRQCGGYEALRLTVVDDVKLGLLLRRAGKRTRAYLGGADVECDWGATAWGTVRIMEKNYFAVLDYRVGLALAGSGFALGVLGILAAALLSGTVAGGFAVLSPFAIVFPGAILACRVGWPWWSAVWVPLMFPLFFISVLNSMWVTLRQGGVLWRNTFYALDQLRLGNVR